MGKKQKDSPVSPQLGVSQGFYWTACQEMTLSTPAEAQVGPKTLPALLPCEQSAAQLHGFLFSGKCCRLGSDPYWELVCHCEVPHLESLPLTSLNSQIHPDRQVIQPAGNAIGPHCVLDACC